MTHTVAATKVPRVLFYSHSGEISGAEISLLLTIEHMKGVHATLASPAGELLERARAAGINTVMVRSHRARMSRNPLQILRGINGTVLAGFRLRKVIRQQEPDVIHANSIRAGLISIIAQWGTPANLFWHVRDNLPKNAIGWVIRQLALFRVQSVFVISNAIRRNFAISRKLLQKTYIVHNGISSTQPPWRSLRHEYGVSDDECLIGVVGQITSWKRQHDAIKAFAKLHSEYPNAKLWIVGDAKFRPENQQYKTELHGLVSELGLSEAVRFIGFREDIMNIMHSIDVLIVPSKDEPFGRVVIEAMLARKPVIGTNGGGIPEIVQEGTTGFLVDTGDIPGMVRWMKVLVDKPALRKKLGNEGHKRVLQHFSADAMSLKILSQYHQVLSEKSGGSEVEITSSESSLRDGRKSTVLR